MMDVKDASVWKRAWVYKKIYTIVNIRGNMNKKKSLAVSDVRTRSLSEMIRQQVSKYFFTECTVKLFMWMPKYT